MAEHPNENLQKQESIDLENLLSSDKLYGLKFGSRESWKRLLAADSSISKLAILS